MPTTTPDVLDEQVLAQISDQGLALYQSKLKAILEPEHNGRTVAIHVDTGDYDLGRNSSQAHRKLRVRHPDGAIASILIGPDQLDQLARRMLGGQVLAGQPK